MALSDEIDSIRLYSERPLFLHAYAAPFLSAYVLWFAIWMGALTEFAEWWELGITVMVIITILHILTCLSCYWSVRIRCLLTCRIVTTIQQADSIMVIPTANNGHEALVKLHRRLMSIDDKPAGMEHWFYFQKLRYKYVPETGSFVTTSYPSNLLISEYATAKGLSEKSLASAKLDFDGNKLDMDIPDFGELFTERATAPFFVFQVFCVGLWCLDEYWYYSLFTLFMLVLFEVIVVKQQIRNMTEIRKMGNKPYSIQVYRCGHWTHVSSDALLPGDVVSIGRSTDETLLVPCDMVILKGTAIVDEALLTGESSPVVKESIDGLEPGHRLDVDLDKANILFGGTRIVQHTPPAGDARRTNQGIKSPDNACLAYVIQTGFSTSQGRLLKTILYGVKRVTANNLETFGFILFLLIFAIAAAAYVWIKGSEDPKRSRYKLLLECSLILTSVIPPELPIELSLAVNNSLVALARMAIFCTEPFRIPFAGKVDVCCFDKTGTLTSEQLVVEGVTGIDNSSKLIDLADAPLETINVLASCHSLASVDEELVGDPLEKAVLQSSGWTVTKQDCVVPPKHLKTRAHGFKIYHRFHFSPTLKRMTVIAGHTTTGSMETDYIVCSKGAPEVIRSLLVHVPTEYDEVCSTYSRNGSRVLALAYRDLGRGDPVPMAKADRSHVESNLVFAGFLIVSCPLKPDTAGAIREIRKSSHHLVMITGDNPLTACHVAKQTGFTKSEVLILTQVVDGVASESHRYVWKSVDGRKTVSVDEAVESDYDFCLTGDVMNGFTEVYAPIYNKILTRVRIYARVDPKQKERAVNALKAAGYTTLMCGDGTNDVAALKHAHVGIALLSRQLLKHGDNVNQANRPGQNNRPIASSNPQQVIKTPMGPVTLPPGSHQPSEKLQKAMADLAAEMEAEERAQIVRLGDASVAAPFTSKLSSVKSVCQVIKQGRCTLVTTLQMFKILAVNALVLAYSQSALYLSGVRYSDGQATAQGLFLAACFLFIARSRPLTTLSKKRPLPNIFNFYTLTTVLFQFSVHFYSLFTLTTLAEGLMPPKNATGTNGTELAIGANMTELSVGDNATNLSLVNGTGSLNETTSATTEEDTKFEPNIVNTVVYLISVFMQVVTFAVNYKGEPFMEPLMTNRPLLISIVGALGTVVLLTTGFLPDLAAQAELIDLTSDVQLIILKTMAIDLVLSFVVDRILQSFSGYGSLKQERTYQSKKSKEPKKLK